MANDLTIVKDNWLEVADKLKDLPAPFQQEIFLLECHAALASSSSYWAAVLPPSERRWMPLIVFSSFLSSARETRAKSVPFGYHLRTRRLPFSTESFSYGA